MSGKVFNHFGPDALFVGAYFSRPSADWDSKRGMIEQDWKTLADKLQIRVTKLLSSTSYQLPKAIIANEVGGLEGIGTNGLTRVLVKWHQWRPFTVPTPTRDFPILFSAEFDLQKGETELVSFHDPKLVRAVCEAMPE